MMFPAINLLVGGFKHLSFSISYMGCHPNPIDELHHFSRWAHCTTNQPPFSAVIVPSFPLIFHSKLHWIFMAISAKLSTGASHWYSSDTSTLSTSTPRCHAFFHPHRGLRFSCCFKFTPKNMDFTRSSQ